MKNEGVFAFPHWDPMDGPQGAIHNGMELRDYFASKIMAALIAEPLTVIDRKVVTCLAEAWTRNLHLNLVREEMFAKAAYLAADAMLAERAK